MKKMHADEIDITKDMVKRLMTEQAGKLVQPTCRIDRIHSSGTVHALYLLDETYVMRLPRIEASQGIEKEWQWLGYLEAHLKTAISTPIIKGVPTEYYPWPWLISRYHQGVNPEYEQHREYEALAQHLAEFLNQLQSIPLKDNAPLSRRGVALYEMDQQTRQEIYKLGDEYNVDKLIQIWDELCAVPEWKKYPVWLHGDFLPGNVLTKNNDLVAVIDFSDVGIGDPACDMVIAWSLLNESSRIVFKEQLKNIDHNTWQRGKGWALSIAAIMLPYYKNTNPIFAALARRMFTEILSDE